MQVLPMCDCFVVPPRTDKRFYCLAPFLVEVH
jgi:hypothetical protein